MQVLSRPRGGLWPGGQKEALSDTDPQPRVPAVPCAGWCCLVPLLTPGPALKPPALTSALHRPRQETLPHAGLPGVGGPGGFTLPLWARPGSAASIRRLDGQVSSALLLPCFCFRPWGPGLPGRAGSSPPLQRAVSLSSDPPPATLPGVRLCGCQAGWGRPGREQDVTPPTRPRVFFRGSERAQVPPVVGAPSSHALPAHILFPPPAAPASWVFTGLSGVLGHRPLVCSSRGLEGTDTRSCSAEGRCPMGLRRRLA